MNELDKVNATRLVESRYFEYDFESDPFPGKEDMDALDSVFLFFEYTLKYATACGYSGEEDTSKLASFLSEKCKEAQVNISRQTLVNWLTKGLPANTVAGRENVYRLCFALRLDANQTKVFFLKAYLERPFNYKNIHEAVYFFCLNNGENYLTAQELIAEIEAAPLKVNPNADCITEQIGSKLSEIKSADELKRYMIENLSGFVEQNKTATEKIDSLVDSCKKVAPKEFAITYPHEKEITVSNVDELLNVIYDYAARATENSKPIYKKSISKSNFPELIKRNWPQREQFAQILEKKTASYDVIRRALIMLTFYDFAANATVNHALEYGIFDEFTDEMNTVLAECGYVQLYWRNPFDWMIGYCAMSPNPLMTLRSLIDEYYLSDPSIFEER